MHKHTYEKKLKYKCVKLFECVKRFKLFSELSSFIIQQVKIDIGLLLLLKIQIVSFHTIGA